MDSVTSEATKIAVAVPGSLGIILAIATFIFMVWLVRFVLRTSEKREQEMRDFYSTHMLTQKAQLDRIETANNLQRAEHQAIIDNQQKSINRQDAVAQILERIVGMLSSGHQPHNS